jgi:hypothetical protein
MKMKEDHKALQPGEYFYSARLRSAAALAREGAALLDQAATMDHLSAVKLLLKYAGIVTLINDEMNAISVKETSK